MADRSVRVTLSANVAGFQAAMGQAQSSVDKLAASTDKAGKGDGLKTASTSADGLADAAKKAETPVLSLGQSIAKASQTDGWKTVSTGLIAFGATAMSVGVLAAKSFVDFDEAMSHVAATGTDAKQNIDALRQAAIQAGAQTKYSATDAANGIEELEKAGMSAADVLGGGLSGALSLAATDQMSVADAATDTATALTQFNLKGSDATHVADLLAAGAGKAMGSVSDMAEALNNGGLVASQMGMSIEQTVGTLASFAQNGIVGAEAGTALKSMLQKLQNPSKEAAAAMKEIGLNAYDAQGKFVGLSSVADQLQNGTKNLTQAQRDQAFATIFGSYAINAANVLYKEGGQGISDWTEKVNDSGYAQKVASDKMNNLKGDLEQLKGSFETLMISMGSGANGPLRSVVEGLTTLVNFLGQHTEAAQVIVGITTAIGGLALGAGIIMKVVTALVEFRQALDTLKESSTVFSALSDKAGAAMGKIATAAWVAAGAIAATQIAAQLLQADHQATTSDQWAEALQKVAKGGSDASAQLDKMFTISHGEVIKDQVNGLADALHRVGAENFGDKFSEGISKITGSSTAIGEAKTQITNYDKSLADLVSNGNMSAANANFSALGTYIKQSGLSASQVVSTFPQLASALQGVATNTTGAALSQQELASWMSGTVPPAVALGLAMQNAGMNTDALTGKQQANAAASQAQAQSLSDVITSIDNYANAALKASGSAIGLEAAIDDATTAVAKNGATTDIDTESGRANMTALNGIASSALSLRDAQLANGASTDEMTASTNRAHDAFIATALQMGMTQDQADSLAKQYGLIPANVATNVTAPGAVQSAAEAQDFYNKVKALPADKQTAIISILNSQGIDAARAALNSLQDKTVTITTNYRNFITNTTTQSAESRGFGYATGGYIAGPGTATSDSIPAWLSNGEFVQQAAAVDYYGASFMHALNSMAVPRTALPRFASGGEVRPSWNTVDRSSRYGSSSPLVVQLPQANASKTTPAQVNHFTLVNPDHTVLATEVAEMLRRR